MTADSALLLAGVAVVALCFALALVLFVLMRRPQGSADLATPLQNLTQSLVASQGQLAVLTEKVGQVAPVTEGMQTVQLELRSLVERVSTVESGQQAVKTDLHSLGTGLAQTSTATGSLLTATEAIRNELAQARDRLSDLQTQARTRQDMEIRTAESIRRLETVIAGTQSKGAAGENILEIVFAKLPADWQVRNFRVGNKAVEFGLRLPNNLILPIDSKWPATALVEQFACCEDPEEQQRLKGQIEAAVLGKAREVKKYIDPNVTVPFGVAAVPDAVYELAWGIQAEVFQQNVVLVAYSMFVPYLLLVFQTVLKTSQNVDLDKLDAHLQTAQTSVRALQEEVEGRFARALTMLGNSRGEMSVHLSKISSGLTNLQLAAQHPDALSADATVVIPVDLGEQA